MHNRPLILTLTLPLLLISSAVCSEDGSRSESSPAPTASSSPTVEMVELEGPGARWWPRWWGPSGQGLVEKGSSSFR